ncbi:MAG: DegT/DnrJ/EryC1/StrS family aminotransferase [Oscillospiraceae bacterium]|nr:DegT/DnrJ/EryC1/StrS family aminotransferase [Oscillospiraceae bacterium]MDD7469621.1 DegT/DnrJ/EryC1/StrS family aminotransferase [Oscillospiraceae bacterium]MDY2678130.1 DegT/DnrJ/EryC1/StrS family aminotransferase [Oscillospiraceae bacterium]
MHNISFSPPDMTEAEVAGAADAIRSGWITTGPKVKEFERRIAARCRTEKAVCLNSATAALEITLRLFGIGHGDEVITTSYTYTASASVIDHVGAKIVLVDTLPESFAMDMDAVRNAVNEKTKAIIAVDIGGVVCDYDTLYKIAEEKKPLFNPQSELQKKLGRIAILADAAHAFGAVQNGKMCGEIADFTSFSFHAVKNLTTAEGGAVTWRNIDGVDNDELYHECQLLSLHGQSKDALAKTRLGAWEYDIVSLAYKCNMTDIMAGIGLAQLERYDKMLDRRHSIIERYNAAFLPFGVKGLPHKTENARSSGHLYLSRVPGITLEERNEIIVKMAEKGIACNVHYKPLPMMTAYKKLGFDIANYKNAYNQFVNEITLPLHTRLTDEEVDYIINCYVELLKEYVK